MKLVNQVLRTVRKYEMLRGGEHVLVAVSGGADSMALLLCLRELAPTLGLKLTVAHLNHRLRGPAADEDQQFVRRWSENAALPFISETIDIKERAHAEKANVEAAARRARYDFLRRSAEAAGCTKIATGHNRNDQAETILFRLLRGTGPGGLAGIHPVREGRIIRPLIECARIAILEFLAARKAEWREDATNRELGFRRNRIRHELIPYLEEHFNPRVLSTLTREAGLAHAAYEFLIEHASAEWARLRKEIPEGAALPVAGLMKLHTALRPEVIKLALQETLAPGPGIDAARIAAILHLCAPGKSGRRVQLPGGAVMCRTLDMLELHRTAARQPAGYEYRLLWPGNCVILEAGVEFVATIEESPAQNQGDRSCAFLDPDMLPPELTIRPRRPGDRYGGKGHRKLKKVLLNARLSRLRRAILPLAASEDAVIWAPGLPPAKNYRAKSGCGRCVKLGVRKL